MHLADALSFGPFVSSVELLANLNQPEDPIGSCSTFHSHNRHGQWFLNVFFPNPQEVAAVWYAWLNVQSKRTDFLQYLGPQ